MIFRIGSLGDTLVALPAFHLIREQYQADRIVLLTNSPVDGGVKAAPSYQILMGSGLVDDYIEYPHRSSTLRGLAALAKTISSLRPSDGIYLMPQRTLSQRLRDAVFFASAGLPRMRGLWPGIDGNRHRRLPSHPNYRESEASRLMRSIGYDPTRLNPKLFCLKIQDSERESVLPELRGLEVAGPFIVMSVGAKVPAKDWGQDHWLAFLGELRSLAVNHALVFVGSADERSRCGELLGVWPHGGLNLCGRLSPRQSAAIMERARLFVGHDSGPMHLASSVGIPCVSIFSARDRPGIWFPYANEKNVFYNLVPCHGCRLDACIEQQMICIRSIKPENVALRVRDLLTDELFQYFLSGFRQKRLALL